MGEIHNFIDKGMNTVQSTFIPGFNIHSLLTRGVGMLCNNVWERERFGGVCLCENEHVYMCVCVGGF
jgi:hypothetical protein